MCLSCCQTTMVSFVTRWLENFLLNESMRMFLKEVRILMTRPWDTEHSSLPMWAGRSHSIGNQKGTSLSVLCQQPVTLVLMPFVLARKSHFWICYCFLELWPHTEWYCCFLYSPAFREHTWRLLISVIMPVHLIINTIIGLYVWLQLFLWRILNDSMTLSVISVFWFL